MCVHVELKVCCGEEQSYMEGRRSGLLEAAAIYAPHIEIIKKSNCKGMQCFCCLFFVGVYVCFWAGKALLYF